MFKPSQIGIRNKIANDPYYRFQSLTEIAIAEELGIKIDVNQATVDDWLRLPGLSIRQARSLVALVEMGVQLVCIEDIAAAIDVGVQHLRLYEPILSFAYYDYLSPLSPVKTNINHASVAQLMIIPKITLILAQKIVAEREQSGKYNNIVDLSSRLNLDPQIISQIMNYLKF